MIRSLIDSPSDLAIVSNYAAGKLSYLTRRQREVLRHLAAGLNQKRAAHEMGISVRTLEIHRTNMMRALEARSFAEAITLWVLGGEE